MEIQRRAQAIATAPRRKRFDDDKEEIEQNKSIKISYQISIWLFFIALLGSITTSALPIPLAIESQHPHSLPQTQSGTNLLPKFRIDPPSQDNSEQLDYTFNQNSRRNRSPSVPWPRRNEEWKH